MAQFKYIKGDNTEGMVEATSADEAIKNAPDRLATSGVQAIPQAPTAPVIPVDSAMGGTPPLPKVDNKPIPSATTGSVSSAITSATTPPPEPVKEDTTARGTMEKLAGKLFGGDQDVASQREAIRVEQQTKEKEAQARLLGSKLTARQREIQKGLEAIEANPRGQTEYALNAEINKYNRETARELADLSFSYNVALGDYQAAEKIVSERLSDIQAQRSQDIQAFNTLFNFVQNDMTESEKLQAQQAFQEKQGEKDFAQRKELMAYENTLKQSDPMYQAQLEKAQRDLAGGGAPSIETITNADGSKVSVIWNAKTGQFEPVNVAGNIKNELKDDSLTAKVNLIDSIINSNAMDSVVGTSLFSRAPGGAWDVTQRIVGSTLVGAAGGAAAGAPFAGVGAIPGTILGAGAGLATGIGLSTQGLKDKLTGERQNFIAGVEQLVSKEFLDSLISVKAQGATFGALQKAEQDALTQAATKIGTWRIREGDKENGKVLGYNASEKDFTAELQTIQRLAQKAIAINRGDVFSPQEREMMDKMFNSTQGLTAGDFY
jgi:hypothetical protein